MDSAREQTIVGVVLPMSPVCGVTDQQGCAHPRCHFARPPSARAQLTVASNSRSRRVEARAWRSLSPATVSPPVSTATRDWSLYPRAKRAMRRRRRRGSAAKRRQSPDVSSPAIPPPVATPPSLASLSEGAPGRHDVTARMTSARCGERESCRGRRSAPNFAPLNRVTAADGRSRLLDARADPPRPDPPRPKCGRHIGVPSGSPSP